MPKRNYNFHLPYLIEGWKLRMGLGQYKNQDWYGRIPAPLRQALEQGEASSQDVLVRQKDLDRLPEDVWQEIRQALGLP